MAASHLVLQGEHLSGIAAAAGFRDFRLVWNHPQNADLRALRQNPHVLFPGDLVFVPDKDPKTLARNSDQRHRFALADDRLSLRIVLDRQMFEPIANAPCTIDLGDRPSSLTTDQTGLVTRDIPMTATDGSLLVQDQIVFQTLTLPVDIELAIHVGGLDPVEQQSGQLARLCNMAYYRLSCDDPLDNLEFRSAVEEFQCDTGLPLTGLCDDATQAKLLEIHGS